jgi:hypothetical protein
MENNITTNTQAPTPEVKKPSALPPRKTIMLIVALVLITVGLVYLSVSSSFQNPEQSPKKETAMNYVQTRFELGTNPVLDPLSSTSATPLYNLDLNITTGQNKVTAVQFEISYDPTAITNVDIKPAGKSETWAELPIKKIDAQNGIITYALGMNPGQKGVSGQGPIAKISFSKAYGFTGQTRISFLPKTMATAEGYDKSVLKSATGTLFSFPEE